MLAEPGVLIVGAGLAGLAVAAELGDRRPVTVVERLPAVGGTAGYEDPVVRCLQARADAAGARWLPATTALRWRGDSALVAGPDGIRWLHAAHLVYAGGLRPCTAAEAGIFGPRVAGLLPATVALHLLEGGVLLGRRVVVLGGGHWARAVGARLLRQPCEVTSVGAPPDRPLDGASRHLSGWRARAIDGRGRVSSVTVERDGMTQRLPCDAVIVAAPTRPLRNVDGAVLPGSRNVTFVQPGGAETSPADLVVAARAAAARLRVPRVVRPSLPVPRSSEV